MTNRCSCVTYFPESLKSQKISIEPQNVYSSAMALDIASRKLTVFVSLRLGHRSGKGMLKDLFC